jgi:curli biogenesis system outer membrane secretion channel CsgG
LSRQEGHLKLRYKLLLLIVIILSSCAADAPYQGNAAVAVWDFDNLTPAASANDDLGEVLSSHVIDTLQKRGDHPVVERQRLVLAMEELKLGSSMLADEETRLRLGRLSGARLMVFGGYQIIGSRMRLDLRLVEVETGKIIKAVQKVSPASDLQGWLNSARAAAEELF